MATLNDFLESKNIKYYLGIYLDILGQGEKLKCMDRIPDTDEEMKQFSDILSETVIPVVELQRSFDKSFEQYQNLDNLIDQKAMSNLSDEQREIYLNARKISSKDMRFSDTMVIYFPLDYDSCFSPMIATYAALNAVASTFITMLADGIPLRGAINIGTGIELKQSGLYGQVLYNLHHLESKIAEYPRIIIGDKLIEMITYYQNLSDEKIDDTYKRIDKLVSHDIRDIIKKDSDNYHILHYLNKDFASDDKKGELKLYERVAKFIDDQLTMHSQNLKLKKRYERLNEYVRNHKQDWE